jgi:chromosome segregation ATPase
LSGQSEQKHKEKVSVSPVPPLPPIVNRIAEAGRLHATEAGPKQTNSQTLLEKGDELEHLTVRCQELEKHLIHAETHIVELQRDAAKRMDEEEEWRQLHLRQFQEEQARMVEASIEAAAEEHKRELAEMRDLLQQECLALKDQLQQERSESQRQSVKFSRLLEEQEARTRAAENETRLVVSKLRSSSSQLQQQQERSIRMAEDKLAHTMAKLDEREGEVLQLKASLKELKATTTEHRKGVEEAEEEMDELHGENEMLRQNLHAAEAERDELTKQLKLFESQKEKTSGLQVCVYLVIEWQIMLYLTFFISCNFSGPLDGAENA